MYSDLKPMVVGDDLVLTSAASVYKMVLPTGHRSIVVRAITTRVSTAVVSDANLPVLTLYNGSTAVKATTALALDAAVGTTKYDEIADGTAGQRFKAGDTLELKVTTEAAATPTPTGKVQVILWID
jgi:hypothetical protein